MSDESLVVVPGGDVESEDAGRCLEGGVGTAKEVVGERSHDAAIPQRAAN